MKNLFIYPYEYTGTDAMALELKNPDANDSISLAPGTQTFVTMSGLVYTILVGYNYPSLLKQTMKLNFTDVDGETLRTLQQLIFRALKNSATKTCKYTNWEGVSYRVKFTTNSLDATANARHNPLLDSYSFQIQLEIVG